MRTVLEVQVEFHVARLGDEVDIAVLVLITAWAQTAHAPSAYTVGTTGKVSFLKRQYIAVAVWIGNAEACMEHQLTVLPFKEPVGEFDVELCILGIGDVEGHILAHFVLLCVEGMGIEVEQVARRLNVRLDGCTAVAIAIAEADLHDEQILVIVFQDGVRVRIVRQILIAEGLADPRHEHIVQVDEIQTIAVQTVLLFPLVVPAGREQTTVELRTVLRVEEQRHLTAGDDAPAVTGTQEREDEPRERQTTLQTVFEEVLIAIAFQSANRLIGATQLHT